MNRITDFIGKLRVSPWVVLCVLGVLLGVWLIDAQGYVERWIGSVLQAASGGLLGFWFSRRVCRLNLSSIADERTRAIAGLAQALVVAAGMLAVTVAV
jgi:hypothetical protein